MTQTPDQYFDNYFLINAPINLEELIRMAARLHFHMLMQAGRIGKAEAAQRALSFTDGARWMKG